MKKFCILSLLALCTITANAEEVVMKALKCQKEYHGIAVGGPIKVFIEERNDGNIIVRATEKIHSELDIKVEKQILKFSLNSFNVKRKSDLIQAEVYIPNNGKLDEFTAVACGIIDTQPQIAAKEVKIECTAASHINIDVVADELVIDVLGASTATIDIQCTSIEADATGASTLSLSGKATKCEADIFGASSFKADTFHSSQVDLECSGASSADISSDMAKVEISGASTVDIDCSTQLKASASGASTIRYSGDCQVDIVNNSGASTIKRK
jgi:hypothetical protein